MTKDGVITVCSSRYRLVESNKFSICCQVRAKQGTAKMRFLRWRTFCDPSPNCLLENHFDRVSRELKASKSLASDVRHDTTMLLRELNVSACVERFEHTKKYFFLLFKESREEKKSTKALKMITDPSSQCGRCCRRVKKWLGEQIFPPFFRFRYVLVGRSQREAWRDFLECPLVTEGKFG